MHLVASLEKRSQEEPVMPWNAPVNVELRGNYLTIQDSPAAAELLLESWPENALGEEYQQALQACVADLEGLPNTARESFIKAVLAAGLSVGPDRLH